MKKTYSILVSLMLAALVPLLAFGASTILPYDKTTLGKNSTGSKELRFNKNAGTGNPGFKYDSSTGKLQFSNDGSAWKAVGSGGGSGGGGVVLNSNYGFEDDLEGWAETGSGTLALVNSTDNPEHVGFGEKSASFDASTSGDYLQGQTVTIPAGLGGKICTFSWYYKGGDSNLKMVVRDITNSVDWAESSDFTAETGYSSKKVLYFTCPEEGVQIAPRLYATGNAAIAYLDDVKLGQEMNAPGSVSGHVGTTSFAYNASCGGWGVSPSVGVYSSFPADNDCVPSSAGKLSNPATNKPAFTIPNAIAGVRYRIRASGFFYNAAGSQYCAYRFASGSDVSKPEGMGSANSTPTAYGNLTGEIVFGSSGSKEVEIQVAATNGTPTCYIYGNNEPIGLHFTVDALSDVEGSQTVSVDKMGWRVQAAITGTGNIAVSTSTESSPVELLDSGLTLVNSGTGAAEIGCQSGTASTGTTCSSSESNAIAFTPPVAGVYYVCNRFTQKPSVNNGTIASTWRLFETSNLSSASIQAGKEAVNVGVQDTSFSSPQIPVVVCSDFSFADTSKRTIRSMYTNLPSGSVSGNQIFANDANGAADGGRNITWTVELKTAFANAVKFTNLVTTGRQNGLKIETASFSQGTLGSTTCSTDPCVMHNSTPGITGANWLAAGRYKVNFAANTWSAPPKCFWFVNYKPNEGTFYYDYNGGPNTTSAAYGNSRTSSGAGESVGFDVMCVGW